MKTHQELLRNLRHDMRTQYVAVNQRTNPIAVHLPELGAGELLHVAAQYAIFPAHIVEFLGAARDTAQQAGWNDVANELERNIGEEHGSRSELVGVQFKGITHYDMLVSGLAQSLAPDLGYSPASDLEEGLRATKAAPAMATFVETMKYVVGNQNPAYAIGATYALESSAVPELVIMRKVVDELCARVTGSPMSEKGHLRRFFDIHLQTWEPGHEEGLRTTTRDVLGSDEQQQTFVDGFHATMKAMDPLWNGLYQETQQRELLEKYAL